MDGQSWLPSLSEPLGLTALNKLHLHGRRCSHHACGHPHTWHTGRHYRRPLGLAPVARRGLVQLGPLFHLETKHKALARKWTYESAKPWWGGGVAKPSAAAGPSIHACMKFDDARADWRGRISRGLAMFETTGQKAQEREKAKALGAPPTAGPACQPSTRSKTARARVLAGGAIKRPSAEAPWGGEERATECLQTNAV